jgi:hypothetical protein
MDLKKKIENNIGIVLLGIVIMSGGITFSVSRFFQHEKLTNLELSYQRKLDECNNAITSINRGVSDDARSYFNIKKVFVKSSDKLDDASKLKFYNSEEFYALLDSSYWKHIMINTFVSAQELSKLDKIDRLKAIESLKKHRSRVHYWSGGKTYTIQNSSMFDSLGNKSIITNISIEKVNIDTLALLNAEANKPGHTEEFKKFYRKQGLMSLLLFFIDQQRIITSKFPEVSFDIQDIQTQDKFIYLKAISQFKNVTINGEKKENFYVKSETFGLLNNDDIYNISIVEPVTDILNSDPEITKWLSSLKIIVK